MRRFLLIVLTIVACIPGATAAAGPSEGPTTSTTIVAASQRPNALPRPNSGQKPTQAGDRGGALQYATFALMCAGLGFIAFRIVASSRRARRRLQQANGYDPTRHGPGVEAGRGRA